MKKFRAFLKDVYLAWNADNPSQLAAALAYYGMFSLAPVIFIALTVAGLFIDDLAMANQLFVQLKDTLGPETAQFMQDIVVNVSQRASRGTALTSLISFGVLLYAASGLFVQLQYALNTIWGAPPASHGGIIVSIKARLLAFIMAMGVGLLLVLATVVSIMVSVLTSFFDWGSHVPITNFVSMVGLATISFALIYKVLPDVEIAWRDVWIGAAVTALLVNIGGWLVGFYLTYSNIGSAFEAAGALAVLLIAFYYIAQIFLFGAAFTKVYASRFGSKTAPATDEALPANAHHQGRGSAG
jgi:membrane protein